MGEANMRLGSNQWNGCETIKMRWKNVGCWELMLMLLFFWKRLLYTAGCKSSYLKYFHLSNMFWLFPKSIQLSSRQLWSCQTRISKTQEVNRGWKKEKFSSMNSCRRIPHIVTWMVFMCKTELFSTFNNHLLKSRWRSQPARRLREDQDAAC